MAEVLSWWPAYLLAWVGIWLYGRHVVKAWARESARAKNPELWESVARFERQIKALDRAAKIRRKSRSPFRQDRA